MAANDEKFILIAFGNIEGATRKTSADAVFTRLFDDGVWYTTRRSQILKPRARLLFYQNGAGFRGHAAITEIAEDAKDAPFGDDHFLTFSQRLSLTGATRFSAPLDPRPIVAILDFISNKTYWGHAFRSTPRIISKEDYLTVLRRAAQEG